MPVISWVWRLCLWLSIFATSRSKTFCSSSTTFTGTFRQEWKSRAFSAARPRAWVTSRRWRPYRRS